MSDSSTLRSLGLGIAVAINPDTLPENTSRSYTFRYIDLSAVSAGSIDWAATYRLTFATAPSRARRKVEMGDCIFGTVRPSQQSHGCIDRNGENIIASTGFAVLRANPDTVDPRFLYHWMFSPSALRQSENLAVGSNYPAVNESDVRRLELKLPPRDEQRRIAEVLDSADNEIRLTERVIAKLDLTWRGLLQHLLKYGIAESGRVRDPGKEPLQFVTTSLGPLPSTWRVLSFGELASYVNGFAFKPEDWTDSGLPIIRIQNINGSRDFNYFDGPVEASCVVDDGDLLFAWSGTRESSFGPTIWRGPRGLLNQHIFKVCEKNSIVCRDFLYLLLMHNLERIAASAHGFKDSFVHVKRSDLTSVTIGVPTVNEQRRIVSIAESEFRLVEAETRRLEDLCRVKAALVDDLLTGRVRVTGGDMERVGTG
jgi:type I restriction enzyme S subunit